MNHWQRILSIMKNHGHVANDNKDLMLHPVSDDLFSRSQNSDVSDFWEVLLVTGDFLSTAWRTAKCPKILGGRWLWDFAPQRKRKWEAQIKGLSGAHLASPWNTSLSRCSSSLILIEDHVSSKEKVISTKGHCLNSKLFPSKFVHKTSLLNEAEFPWLPICLPCYLLT